MFDYDYLQYHVTTDLQKSQVVGNLYKGQKNVEPILFSKRLFKYGKSQRDEDILINKVDWWLKKNKVKTL